MSTPVTHPEATAEFLDAVAYYEDKQDGLGERFRRNAAGAVADVQDNPEAWPKLPGWDRDPVVRSRGIEGFPYRVVYFLMHKAPMLVAFAHDKRRPRYWARRIRDLTN